MKLNEREFNLIDEPWIRVMDENCKVVEVSLLDAIINAHKYKSLSGELPTQDVAVMRLILAVIHTVVSRYDEYGDENDLEDSEDDALDRWKGLWEQGYFPENAVREYLEQWHERFWLFHPDRPFGQVAGLTKGTKINAMKLNGEIAQSNNKIRFFSSYFGDDKIVDVNIHRLRNKIEEFKKMNLIALEGTFLSQEEKETIRVMTFEIGEKRILYSRILFY